MVMVVTPFTWSLLRTRRLPLSPGTGTLKGSYIRHRQDPPFVKVGQVHRKGKLGMRGLCSSVAAACVLWTQPIGAQGLDDLPNWRVSSNPILSIGLVDGPEPYLLYDVTSLRLTSRGQIIVANAGTGEVRVFDSDGAFVGAVGRRGQGPGEYQHLTGIELFARDSLIVFDRDLRRLSVFSPSGQFLRSFWSRLLGAVPPRLRRW